MKAPQMTAQIQQTDQSRILGSLRIFGLLCALFSFGQALILTSCATAQVVEPTPAPPKVNVPAPEESERGPFEVPQVSDEFIQTASEADMVPKILALHKMLPEDLRKPATMTIEQLHGLVDTTLALSDSYLKRFPSGEGRKTVLPAVCKLWVINNTRYFVAVNDRYKSQNGTTMQMPQMMQVRAQYWDMVLTLIDEAIHLNPEGRVHEELLTLQGQASWFGQRFDKAIESYKEVLAKYPNSPKNSENLLALLNSYLTSRNYDMAVRIADRFLREYPRDLLVPHVYQLKAKALLEGGRAQEALVWWLQSAGFLADAAAGRPVIVGDETYIFPSVARQSFRRYSDESGFMIGFLHGYLGDFEAARLAFADALEKLMDLQAKNAIDPRSQVFLGRTDKVHNAYLTFVGNPTPSYDITTWLDDLPIDPVAENGNVVVLIFAPYENARYDEFLTISQKLYVDHWHEGLRVGWISDPKGFSDLPSQIGRLSAQRNRLELTFPIGLESEKGWPNYKKYQASVGGGTLVVVGRDGKVAWYKMDPTYRDENLIKNMVRRLLDQAP